MKGGAYDVHPTVSSAPQRLQNTHVSTHTPGAHLRPAAGQCRGCGCPPGGFVATAVRCRHPRPRQHRSPRYLVMGAVPTGAAGGGGGWHEGWLLDVKYKWCPVPCRLFVLFVYAAHFNAPPPSPEFSLTGGGVPGTQKAKSLCTKNSQINISFCTISCFPTMKSGSGGGGVSPPPPPQR